MVTYDDKVRLWAIIEEQRQQIDKWQSQVGRALKPPYPSDSPCYYCEVHECDWCIHNANPTKLLELLDNG
jgi:hypothetical protein